MKQKGTTLLLLLLLVSMVLSAFSIQTVEACYPTGTPPLRGDVNYDGIVNRKDIAIVRWALRSYPEHPRWNPMADLNQDGKVNRRDLRIVRQNLGTRWIPGDGLTGEISIGAVLPLSGPLPTYGESEQVAMELAVEEVNTFLGAHGAGWTLNLLVEDSELNPGVCYDKVVTLHEDYGIDFIVGPLTSGETLTIKPYCDDENILTISHGATASLLAIPEDYIFRFYPTDVVAGQAIGRLLYDDGKSFVIPVWMNDIWANGLKENVRQKFEGLGGIFLEGVTYTVPDPEDFTDEAADLAGKVTNAITLYGADQIAVLHIGFQEVNQFMTACLAHVGGSDDLDDVKWYGSDGTVQSGNMLADPGVREFAMAVEYPCPQYALTESARYEKVRQHGVDTLGREPDQMAYTAYDAVWAIAYCLMTVDAYDSVAAKAVLSSVVENYFGASGWVTLDENGDRTVGETGNFDFWQITDVPEPQWVKTAKYIYITDSIVWY